MLFKNSHNPWVICDLDGTLCQINHRVIYAKMKQWDEFHSRLADDEARHSVLEILQLASKAGRKIAIITGRPQKYLNQTLSWLMKFDVPFNELYMRDDGDKRSDVEYKSDIYANHFLNMFPASRDVLLVMEDRDRVVEMWRNLFGLTCFQVQRGDY